MSSYRDPQSGQKSESDTLQSQSRQTEPGVYASGATGSQTDDQTGSKVDQAKETGREAAETARKQLDERRGQAAEGMRGAADKMRERADSLPGGQRSTEAAQVAADKVEGIASYLSQHNFDEMTNDLAKVARRKPKESLIAAAGAGLLVGWVIRR